MNLDPSKLTLAITLCLASQVAMSQAESPVLEEVTVTATKRATSLQETPIAITALSEAKLEQQNVDNLSEIATFTPNLVFEHLQFPVCPRARWCSFAALDRLIFS